MPQPEPDILAYLYFRKGLASDIDSTATKNSALEGEPAYTTDDKRMYIHDGTEYIPVVRARSTAPSSASDTGVEGEIAYDSSYVYICTATDTWKRVAIATW